MRANVNRAGGFSTLELTVVAGTVLVLMASLLPSVTAYLGTHQLTIAARDVATFLHSARMLAASRDEPVLVDFLDRGNFLDPAANVIYVAGMARTMRAADLNGTVFQGLESRSLRDVNFILIPDSAAKRIRFNSRGSIANQDTSDPLIRVGNTTGTIDIIISRNGKIQIVDNRSQ